MTDTLLSKIGKHSNPYYDMGFLTFRSIDSDTALGMFDNVQHNFWQLATVFAKAVPRGAFYGAIGGTLSTLVGNDFSPEVIGLNALVGAVIGLEIDSTQYLLRAMFRSYQAQSRRLDNDK